MLSQVGLILANDVFYIQKQRNAHKCDLRNGKDHSDMQDPTANKIEHNSNSQEVQSQQDRTEKEARHESSLTEHTGSHEQHQQPHYSDSEEPEYEPAKPIKPHIIEVKEEECGKRGRREKVRKERPDQEPKGKIKKRRLKHKREMKKRAVDDPRNRGIPKVKKITKRKNKPKILTEEAKRQQILKKEEQEYRKKIANRGKKAIVKKLRGERKRKELLKKKKQDAQKLKLEPVQAADIKVEQSEEQEVDSVSSQSEQSNQSQPAAPKEVKRKVSRKQKQLQRDEDKRKVDRLMTAKGERKRREQIQTMVRMQRQMAAKFGTKIMLDIDPTCKYYNQYKFRKGEIEKSGKLYCQIYNKHPIPAQGMHFFQMKIARLTFQSVTIGVITAHNFHQQYSRDKLDCICFDAYTHSTYIEGAKTELQVEVKINDIVRTVVDIPNATVQWYINNDFISEAIIPLHMTAIPLYPYLQVSNKWIRLKINDFQQ